MPKAETGNQVTMSTYSLEPIIAALLTPGKGILAADESFPTIEKRFRKYNIPSTPQSRRAYREMLFTTPSLDESISGAILFDETIRQTTDGLSMPAALARQGIVPGIKVDKGTVALPGSPKEKITEGLDGLYDRLIEYRELGARFTKWRAVLSIGDAYPSRNCLEENADVLARFAALSQTAGLVPIVEPEVSMSGDHTLDRCEDVTASALDCVFGALYEHQVALAHMLLKTGMVVSGADCSEQADDASTAKATLRCLRHSVPIAVPGILFLSGGQSDVDATVRLNAICAANDGPWTLSFSFGRALQDQPMKIWSGFAENIGAAQAALNQRARCNGLAVEGRYTEEEERESVVR